MQLTNNLVSICCNNVLSVTGSDIYISVMTIISSVRQMVETPIHAINEGTGIQCDRWFSVLYYHAGYHIA